MSLKILLASSEIPTTAIHRCAQHQAPLALRTLNQLKWLRKRGLACLTGGEQRLAGSRLARYIQPEGGPVVRERFDIVDDKVLALGAVGMNREVRESLCVEASVIAHGGHERGFFGVGYPARQVQRPNARQRHLPAQILVIPAKFGTVDVLRGNEQTLHAQHKGLVIVHTTLNSSKHQTGTGVETRT